jgi:hypothetical protein
MTSLVDLKLKVEQPVPERQVKEPGKQRVDAGIGSTAEARGGGGHLTKDTRRLWDYIVTVVASGRKPAPSSRAGMGGSMIGVQKN